MRLVSFLNLKNISGQIAALVVASIVAIHLILTATFMLNRPELPDPTIDRGHAQLAAAVQLLGSASAAERPLLYADIARAFPQLDIENLPPGPVPLASDPDRLDLRSLHRRLDSSYRIFLLAQDGDSHRVGIALPDGTMISARLLPDLRQRPFWGGPWMATLLFAIVSVSILGLWAARALTAPLSSIAKAAENFSLMAQHHRCPSAGLRKFAPSPRRSTGCGNGSRP
jgi:HAMP domain-containing protein